MRSPAASARTDPTALTRMVSHPTGSVGALGAGAAGPLEAAGAALETAGSMVFETTSLSTLGSLGSVVQPGSVLNDAYGYEDGFADNVGIDLGASPNIQNLGGIVEATAANVLVVSRCFGLPQPAGATFGGWLFADLLLAQTANLSSHRFEVQTCAGVPLVTLANPTAGGASVDLRSIPTTTTQIRLAYVATHTGTPNGSTVRPVQLDLWRVYGSSTGATTVTVTPTVTGTTTPGTQVTMTVAWASTGARTRNAVLSIPLSELNGLSANGIAVAPDDGLNEDAEHDYGNGAGLMRWWPMPLVNAGDAPGGVAPTLVNPGGGTTLAGAVSGEVTWNLGAIEAGSSGSVTASLTVPMGFAVGKRYALRARLRHGATPLVPIVGLGTTLAVSTTTPTVTVNGTGAPTSIYRYQSLGTLGPGATGQFYFAAYGGYRTADLEGARWTIDLAAGTCRPVFRGIVRSNPPFEYGTDATYPWRQVSGPAVGQQATAGNPVVVHFDRARYDTGYTMSIYVDVPTTCTAGQTVTASVTVTGTNPAVTVSQGGWTFSIVSETCHSVGTGHYVVRGSLATPTGNSFLGYYWPGWPEQYEMIGGAWRPGEYVFAWSPYAGESYRTNTVKLDRIFASQVVQPGVTLHALAGNTRAYKDSTGTAPLPDQAGFDPMADPPHSAWKPVDQTSYPTPFVDAPNDANPRAVVGPGTRLLYVKWDDNPPWVPPDYGWWVSHTVWRMADGSFGVPELPDGTSVSVNSGLTGWSYQRVSAPNMRNCGTTGGGSAVKGSWSYPMVRNLTAEPVAVPAGQPAVVTLVPHNRNAASARVDGRWAFNLFAVRNQVDLDNVSGSVVSAGFSVPAGGNVAGITFTPPNRAACLAATSSTGTACLAVWTVPLDTQVPNAWGNKDVGGDDYVSPYRFRLSVPILRTVPAGTVLSFTGEVRTSTLAALGADNAAPVSYHGVDSYSSSTTVSVLESPLVTVDHSGPANWPRASTFTWVGSTTNSGNAPSNGIYAVSRLPVAGVGGNQFTPGYGKVYVTRPAADLVVETSTDAACLTTPTTGTWTGLALVASARAGYVAETSAAVAAGARCVRVRRNPSSSVSFAAGSLAFRYGIDVVLGPNGPASFNDPRGMAVDGAGNLYLADHLNHRIRRITPAGIVTTVAGSGSPGFVDGTGTAASFNSPMRVAFDGAGNLYVADRLNHAIRRITPAGVVTTLAGNGSPGYADGTGAAARFREPNGLALDPGGVLVVSDAGNHRIRRVTTAGVVTTLAGSGSAGFADGTGVAASFNTPASLAVAADGTTYVADQENHRIRAVSPTGSVSTVAGSATPGSADGTGTAAQFNRPADVAVTVDGTLFVADNDNHRIRRISPTRVVTTLAGSGAAGSTDGTGTAATFNFPRGITVGADGALLVTEAGGHRVRRVTTAGAVTTFAGDGVARWLDTATNDGLNLTHRMAGGALAAWGSSADLAPIETSDLITQQNATVITSGVATAVPDLTTAGAVRWDLTWRNTSGTVSGAVDVTTQLPAELLFDQVVGGLPAGTTCVTTCAVQGAAGDGSGGFHAVRTASLAADDGNAVGGDDQRSMSLATRIKAGTADGRTVAVCVVTNPGLGAVGSNRCATTTTAATTVALTQTVVPAQGGTPPRVSPNDVLRYQVSVTNTGTAPRFVRVFDALPPLTAFVSGSFQVDGATASDGAFAGSTLVYTGTVALSAGATQVLRYDARVDLAAANNTDVANTAVVTLCSDRTDVATCAVAKETPSVLARVAATASISGTVFEDLHYGGGAGRSRAGAVGVGRPGVRVELYLPDGRFSRATTTAADGTYAFTEVGPGDHTVRVVTSTVTSSRSGAVAGQWPVQTLRTAWNTSTNAADPNRVGGENPALADAAANTTAATLASLSTGGVTPHSVSVVRTSLGAVVGVDVGFHFATVVNTNTAGQGSLAQAIANANALGDDAALLQAGRLPGVEHVVFMIGNGTAAPGLRAGVDLFTTVAGGARVATIRPTASTLLPTVATTMTIDAQAQPGWSSADPRPVVELDGSLAGISTGVMGIESSAANVVIRGFVVNRFAGRGLFVRGAGSVVEGNWVGLTNTGTAPAGNGVHGISIRGAFAVVGGSTAAQRNVVGGHLGGGGIVVDAPVAGVRIAGNRVGTNPAGTAAVRNLYGIWITEGATGAVIGGGQPGEGNLVSGNDFGIVLGWLAGAGASTVQGNLIGTDVTGTAALANGLGVQVADGSGHLIGGPSAATRNVISGNTGAGILLGASAGTVLGNHIGTNALGTAAIANVGGGVSVTGSGHRIGSATAGNLISGNAQFGIALSGASAANNVVQGNRIGTDVAGVGAVPNQELGVGILSGASGNTVGGVAAGEGNTIAYNNGSGIAVYNGASSGNVLRGNSIFGTTGLPGLGIDLGRDGVTVNDGATSTSAPNRGMDTAVLTNVTAAGNTVTVSGYVGSAPGQATFAADTVDLYLADGNVAGYRSGRTWIGSVTTDALNGNFSNRTVLLPAGVTVSAGVTRVVATATDATAGTSEFGLAASVADLAAGLVGHWKLDETGGLAAADATGRANHGTLTDMAGTEWTPGVRGGALRFDVGDRVRVPNRPELSPTAGVSVAAWVNRTAPTGSFDPIVKKSNGAGDFALEYTASGAIVFSVYVGGTWRQSPTVTVPDGSWSHLVGTYDGQAVRLYRNGVEVGSGTAASGSIVTSTSELHLAGDPAIPTRSLRGLLDDVRLYDRALAAIEVRALFDPPANAGAIAGTVFEDVHYGGGPGRDRATALAAGGTGRLGARVELYRRFGATTVLVAVTASDGSGAYSFGDLVPGDYRVRTVLGTVRSGRAGATDTVVGVQSFRTEAVTGTVVPVTGEVGGADPARADALANTAGATLEGLSTATVTPHNVTAATVGTSALTGMDVGVTFSTITTSLDDIPGSLRRVFTNLNTFSDQTALRQAGRPAGVESTIFALRTTDPGYRSATGHWRFALASALPTLTRSRVAVDGLTQTGAAAGNLWSGVPHTLRVELAGAGVVVNADDVVVRGLVVGGTPGTAVVLSGARNRLSTSYVGLDVTGTTASSIGSDCVHVAGSDPVVGGPDAGDGNVIGGGYCIVGVSFLATGVTVRGNFIGSDATGTAIVGSRSHGIAMHHGATTFREIRANVIAGNGLGISAQPDDSFGPVAGATSWTIAGNHIGVGRDGRTPLPNTIGIDLDGATANTIDGLVIGGTGAGDANVIAGNLGDGIRLAAPRTTGLRIIGNRIGRDAADTMAVPNAGDGIDIAAALSGPVTIGGVGSAANVISGNGGAGVRLGAGLALVATIRGNQIYGNTGPGIDLGGDGPTPNDGGRTAGQPNGLIDTPILHEAVVGPTTLTVSGFVGSGPDQPAFANTVVDVYESDARRQGRRWLGSLSTDASGAFLGTFTGMSGLAPGTTVVTATATDAAGNTSEFSPDRASVALQNFRNGSFETAPPPSGGSGFTLGAGNDGLDGWVLRRGGVDVLDTYWQHADGARSLDLSAVSPGGLHQTFRTVPGETYVVRFSIAANPAGTPVKALTVRAPGTTTSFAFDTTGRTLAAMGWGTRSVTFVAVAEASTVRFDSDTAGNAGPALDAVSVWAGSMTDLTGSSLGAATVVPGGGASVPVTLVNVGTTAEPDASFTLTMPAGVRIDVAALPRPCALVDLADPRTVRCRAVPVPANGTVVVDVPVWAEAGANPSPTPLAPVAMAAVVTGSRFGSSVTRSATVTVDGARFRLALEPVTAGSVAPGGVGEVTLQLRNLGPSDAHGPATVTYTPPAGTRLTAAPSMPAGVQCAAAAPYPTTGTLTCSVSAAAVASLRSPTAPNVTGPDGTPLALWLDAADPGTFVADASGVSQWLDKSGNGRHASATDPTRRPQLDPAGFEGHPGVVFTRDRMSVPVAASPGPNGTVFAVMRSSTSTDSCCTGLINLDSGPTTDNPEIRFGLNDGSVAYWNGTYVVSAATGADTASLQAVSFTDNAGTITGTLWRNGTAVASGSRPGPWSAPARFDLGWYSRIDGQRDGVVAELIVVAGPVSVAERQRIEGYLATKWGLTARLPAGHPFADGLRASSMTLRLPIDALGTATADREAAPALTTVVATAENRTEAALRILPLVARTPAWRATSSSVDAAEPAATATRALDGDTAGGRSVFRSEVESAPWWQLDLGRVTRIGGLRVWGSPDVPGESTNLLVYVADVPFRSPIALTPGLSVFRVAGNVGRVHEIALGRAARFVQVRRADPGRLGLAEVQVLRPFALVDTASAVATSSSAASASTQAGEAIDGGRLGFAGSADLFVSASEPNPWWRLDLGAPQAVGSVRIWGRTDGFAAQTANLEVSVSDDGITWGAPVASATTVDRLVELPVDRLTRHVRVRRVDSGVLALAEVQLTRGSAVPLRTGVSRRSSSGLLATTGWVAQQSSTDGANAAARALDGNTDGRVAAGSVTLTGSDAAAWWQVDMQAVRPVGAVRLWNRSDTRLGLRDLRVQVSADPFGSDPDAQDGVWTTFVEGAPGDYWEVPVFRNARYLRVTNTSGRPLSIAEVQVTDGAGQTRDVPGTPGGQAPVVAVVAPTTGATVTPIDGVVRVEVVAADPDPAGSIQRVELRLGTVVIGTLTAAPYVFLWSPPPGAYTLTAFAVDNSNASATSSPVAVTVQSARPGPPGAPAASLTSVATVAGSGAAGALDGTGAAARFNWPEALALDGAGGVIVADRYNGLLRRVSAAGAVTTVAGGLAQPIGVAADGTGGFYVTEYSGGRLSRVSATGVVTTVATGLAGPMGVAVDRAGVVHVSEFDGHRIRRITPTGVVSTLAGSGLPGAIDGVGTAASFTRPAKLDVDPSGVVFVADYGTGRIRRVDPAGVVSTVMAGLAEPTAVTLDRAGNLYVGENTGGWRVRRVTPAGADTVLAGNGAMGAVDGPGALAGFAGPFGFALDDDNGLWIADGPAHRIRRLTLTGPGTTVLTWTAPTVNATTVTDYAVEFRVSPSGPWSTFPDGTSIATQATLTGLTDGVAYDVRIRGVGTAGAGDPSGIVTVTTRSVPGAPGELTVVPGAGSLLVSWPAPA
ncbi:MAG: choice-of-anchor C family protein, partial [Acidimicrobiales bacterium]